MTAGANPLLAEWKAAVAAGEDPVARDDLVHRYSFAIPDDRALRRIRAASPNGVIEIGAGAGYWARLLTAIGVDVVAVDPEPAPSVDNEWFAGVEPWAPVERGDHTRAADYGDRTLLLVWPTRNETWASDAVRGFVDAGGEMVAYVGEPAGGRTGDAVLHVLLGGLDRCWACGYGVDTWPCICGMVPMFEVEERIDIPRWGGFEDELRIARRVRGKAPLAAHPERSGGRGGWARRLSRRRW